jgi:hypothetical protein
MNKKPERDIPSIRYETVYNNGEYEILEWKKVPFAVADKIPYHKNKTIDLANEILEHCEQSIPGISNLWSVDSDNIKLESEEEFGCDIYTRLIPLNREISIFGKKSILKLCINHFQGFYNLFSPWPSRHKTEFIVTIYPEGNEWRIIPNSPNPAQQFINSSKSNLYEFLSSYLIRTERIVKEFKS